jgi:hypothetical protein
MSAAGRLEVFVLHEVILHPAFEPAFYERAALTPALAGASSILRQTYTQRRLLEVVL